MHPLSVQTGIIYINNIQTVCSICIRNFIADILHISSQIQRYFRPLTVFYMWNGYINFCVSHWLMWLILIFPNPLCKSLLKKYTAIDNKILYFLHLNKSLGVHVLGKRWTKNNNVGESVTDFFSHTYVTCFFYINVFI